MAKHKYIFEYEDNSDDILQLERKLKAIVSIDDYLELINYMFNRVLRYKHKEDELIKKYGDKALDLIDKIKDDLIEFMEANSIPIG